ncbi:unnamed protein product, partial [Iphiclides podalirius]
MAAACNEDEEGDALVVCGALVAREAPPSDIHALGDENLCGVEEQKGEYHMPYHPVVAYAAQAPETTRTNKDDHNLVA